MKVPKKVMMYSNEALVLRDSPALIIGLINNNASHIFVILNAESVMMI